jgi:hypothetical protein
MVNSSATMPPPNASFGTWNRCRSFRTRRIGEALGCDLQPLRELTRFKPCLDTLLPMPNQPAAANAHHPATPFAGSQPWEAPDPLPVMRRELKLLLIEMNVLRVEVEQLRAMEREARNTEEFLSACVNRLLESRDHWRREAERLNALITQVPPWSLLWWSCVDAFKAWRRPTDRGLHWA